MRSLVYLFVLSTLLSLTLMIAPAITFGAEAEQTVAVAMSANLDLKVSTTNFADFSFSLSEFNQSEITIGGESFSKLQIDGEENIGPEGWPELPSVRRFVLIPPQSGVEVRIKSVASRLVDNVNPIPHQVLLDGDENRDTQFTSEELVRDLAVKEYDGFWPPQIVRVGRPAILRGYRLVPITINPLRWNPQTGELQVIDDLDFELNFDTEVNRVNIVADPERPKPSKSAYQILSQLVVNPPEPQRDMGLNDGAVVYVTGAGGNYDVVAEALQPLIEWRRRMGWTVTLLRADQPTNRVAVKNQIQALYDDADVPPEMIVIVGDTDGQYPVAFFDHRVNNNYPYESDHDYTMLDGDDVLPDAALGRFCFGSPGDVSMLRGIVTKIINYESNPFIGEGNQRGWQKRAAVFAGNWQSGLSSIDVCRWVKEILIRNDYNQIHELYWSNDNREPPGQAWITDRFNSGINFYVYRGWTFMNGFRHEMVDQLNNRAMLPFVMLPTCNTGDYAEHVSSPYYYSERFLYYTRGGAIGAVGAGGATHTAYNNLFTAGVFRAFFGSKIPYQGWATMAGKVELYNHYFDRGDIEHHENRGIEAWLCELYIFNLIGDPATDLFTDIPNTIHVSHPANLRPFETQVTVAVTDADREPLPGARVCLYKPGDGGFQLVVYTNEDGEAPFALDPDWTEEGEIQLTVTGHNLMPYLEDLAIRAVDFFLGAGDFTIDDDAEGESIGDDDGTANPTERIELTVGITNYGTERPEGAVHAVLTPGLPNLEVVVGEADLDEAPAPEESADVSFVVDIGGGFPDEQAAVFNLQVTVGEESWHSAVRLPLEGPEFKLVRLTWDDDPLSPAEVADCHIRIQNVGSKRATALDGTLISLTPSIDVPVFEAGYNSIAAGGNGNSLAAFRLAANLFHLGGSPANLALILSNEEGFVDTVFISFPVDQARDGQPFGPDKYGYICLDDTDQEWFTAPVYDWIELDPHRRGPGTDTELRDTAEEGDASVLVELPFEFQYYGQDFNEITICTNGWVAMGDCHELITARNRKLPAGENPPGMIAPFWDDLLTTDDGGIYYHYDDDNGLFIVEWSQMRRLGPQGGNEAAETFQVVFYDPEVYPTITGDGDFVFQYLDVTDARSCFQEWDTPYASVGICSPDQGDGLTYTYWGELSGGAAPLQDRRAIKFTTSILATTGSLFGTVVNAENDEPIAGASVYTVHGFVAVTDDEGHYRIEHAPADIDFEITATITGFNDSTVVDLILEDEEELEVNFALLHPEFVLSTDRIEAQALLGDQAQVEFSLANEGNGPLSWLGEVQNPGGANADPWELRRSVPVGEIIDVPRIQGAIFANGNFYVAGTASREEPAFIYVINLEGELIDQFLQVGEASYGYRDLAWDGETIWGSGVDVITGLNLEGEVVAQFEGPYSPNNNLAWDPDRELIWVSSTTTDFVGIDREGNEVAILDRQGLRVYGLAYWPFDPDGYNLYIFHRDTDVGDFLISKMNPANGALEFVRMLEPEGGGAPIGAYISNQFDYFSWVFLAVVNNGSADRIDIWQMASRRDWALLDPSEGTLDAEEIQDLVITLDASNMPEVELQGELHFYHNAEAIHTVIPISFNIVGEIVRENTLQLAQGWNLISINLVPPREFWLDDEALGPDVLLMTGQLRVDEDSHHVQVFKDQDGRFYAPQFNFNNIPYWNLRQGYQINVDEDTELHLVGAPIPADAEIPIRENWNIVAYLPDYPLAASAPDFYVISNLRDHIELAKDVDGRFMLPDFGFSNMLPWIPGQGYMLKADANDLVLIYPPPLEEDEVAAIRGSEIALQNEETINRTSKNMSLLISAFENLKVSETDRVIAIDLAEHVIGSGEIQQGMCGLAIWGDDPTTEVKDGLSSGEVFRLALLDDSGNIRLILNPSQVVSGSGLVYETDAFTVLEVSGSTALPEHYFLDEGYPNPFNAMVRLNYGLPEVSELNISVFDLHGRLVDVLHSGQLQAGFHSTVWNADARPSGLYWVRMEAQGFSQVRKVMLVK